MNRRILARNALLLLIFCSVAYAMLRDQLPGRHSTGAEPDAPIPPTAELVVTYFDQGKNCPTCDQLPLLTKRALDAHFADALHDGSIVWRTVNVEEQANEHYVHEYKLYSKSVVLSKRKAGAEIAWKNLDAIWDLVGDEAAFVAYVREEVNALLELTS